MTETVEQTVDLGCGSKKTPGALGVDIYPFPGVDVVTDLNSGPWPLEDSRFSLVNIHHIIEHVADVVPFLQEVHRIAKPGARVVIITPHYSSMNSWADPTHLRHLASTWYEPFMAGGYLSGRTGVFALEYSRVKFGKSVRAWYPRLICRLFGQGLWEKHYAFRFPATDLHTVLTVVK